MMPNRFVISALGLVLGCLLTLGLVGGQDGPFGGKEKKPKGEKLDKGDKEGKDRYSVEDKAVLKFAEKSSKPIETERDKWLKELDKAFPGRVSPGLNDADFNQWFDLLSGGGRDWQSRTIPTKQLRELFERACERLNLSPDDDIRRDEFLRYARMNLLPGNSPPWKADKSLNDVDKLFRELDRDGSGFLESHEWTDRLTEAVRRVDTNRDGRIDRDEYLAYIQGRVATTIERGPEPPAVKPDPLRPSSPEVNAKPAPVVAIRAGHLPSGVPGWFAEADINRDGQIELWEWRRASRPIDEFVRLDLDRDGLLYPDEYLRAVRLLEAETRAAARDASSDSPERGSPSPERGSSPTAQRPDRTAGGKPRK